MINFANRKVITVITVGILVHILILAGVLEVYFSSPIDHGMRPVVSTTNPPAKRVVFIVADGLRSEAIYGATQIPLNPNLYDIRKNRGSWGVSHTRVPTESRPGHVALLAGIYEDPSAMLKGWTSNPVDFDSVINQSTNAWCWGGPSVINMFNKDNSPHIHLHSYDPSLEDFGNNNTIGLDAWVFDEVENFIFETLACENCTHFWDNGNFFFLHLLGTDTAGHGFKPKSKEYRNNIKFVDDNILRIESLFEDAFPDHSTAYVFTADHGMTDWGSHGSGSYHETETPFIAWGAGIKVEDVQKDIKQVDVAPLLSALMGINYPINSLGRLPNEYVDVPQQTLAEMILTNVFQLTEIFNVKKDRILSHSISFVPFFGFSEQDREEKEHFLMVLASQNRIQELKSETETYIDFLLQGADYYHNYFQLPLLMALTVGIIEWLIFLASFNVTLRHRLNLLEVPSYTQFVTLSPIYASAIALIYAQKLPLTFYVYFLFPIVMFQVLINRMSYILEGLKKLKIYGIHNVLFHSVLYMAGLRLLVQGFQRRENFTIVMFVVASFVMFSESLKFAATRNVKLTWVFVCIILSIFPSLSVMRTNFNIVSYLGGYFVYYKCLQLFIYPHIMGDLRNRVIDLQHMVFKFTPLYTLLIEFDIIASDSYFKYISWFWATIPLVMIPFSSARIYTRLTSIFLSFGTFYLMVSTNYELLFLTSYVMVLYVWLLMEGRVCGYASITRISFLRTAQDDIQQTSDDFRRAFFFLVLILQGFFGTGNIASLNSFDPMWVRCFLTVFSPFKMAGLILLRIMIPFIFTSCTYRGVNLMRQGETLHMFCIVLMFSDVMLLEVMYYITNIGSWLEIGMSFSQFIIMEAFVLILLLLYGIAYFFTTKSWA